MSEPLKTRLGNFGQPKFPPAHLGLLWRRAVETDFWKIRELIKNAEADEQPVRPTAETEIDLLGDFLLVRGRELDNEYRTYDCIVGIDRDGKLQAFGAVSLYQPEKELARANLFAVTTKKWRGRGIGRSLLNWQDIRAREILLDYYGADSTLPAQIRNVVDEKAKDRRLLYVAAGFSLLRKITVYRRQCNNKKQIIESRFSDIFTASAGGARLSGSQAGSPATSCSHVLRPVRDLTLSEWQAVKELHEKNSQAIGASVEDAIRWWDRVQSNLAPEISVVVMNPRNGRCEAYCLCQKRDYYEGTETVADQGEGIKSSQLPRPTASVELFGAQPDASPSLLAATLEEVVKQSQQAGFDCVTAEDNRDQEQGISQLLQSVDFQTVGARMIYTVDF